jgi:hypothetical protein
MSLEEILEVVVEVEVEVEVARDIQTSPLRRGNLVWYVILLVYWTGVA